MHIYVRAIQHAPFTNSSIAYLKVIVDTPLGRRKYVWPI
jgi:hypothetical protein